MNIPQVAPGGYEQVFKECLLVAEKLGVDGNGFQQLSRRQVLEMATAIFLLELRVAE